MAQTDQYGKTVYEGYDFDSDLRRRLGTISGQYQNRSQQENFKSSLDANRRAFEERYSMQQAGVQSLGLGSKNADSLRQYGADLMGRVNSEAQRMNANPWSTGQQSAAGGGGGLNSFIRAIGDKESNNNYRAVNRHSGALGKYQIMPSNIRQWSQQALGYSVTPAQFLASPQIQEKVARYHLSSYYQKYGAAGASIAWYAGPAAAQRYVRSGGVSSRGEANGYPSVAKYAQAILAQMRRYR
jgi:hypothetical protein